MLTRGINCNLFNNIKDNLRAIIKKMVLKREIPAMMVGFVDASEGILIAALQLQPFPLIRNKCCAMERRGGVNTFH